MLFASCAQTEDEKAASLLSRIKILYNKGNFAEVLDSITALRTKFPKAIESRKQALHLWQNASLKLAQEDVAKTDSALQAMLKTIPQQSNLYRANMMRAECDSLKARYEAMCGVVRMIRIRQKQELQPQK